MKKRIDEMTAYDTITDALNGLRKNGYVLDFNIAFDKLMCSQNGVCLNPEQFEITNHFRFEGNTDPADEAVVYAVESKDGKMKGVLVSAYGVYSDPVSDEMIRKLAVH
jgi:hypothetical protein